MSKARYLNLRALSLFQVSAEDQAAIEAATVGQNENPEWYRHRYGRITASNAKAYCGNGNPVPLVRAVLQKSRDPSRTLTSHMRYGIENKDNAVLEFIKQQHEVTVRKCGLFIDLEHGQLAASPDWVAFVNGEAVLLEVKCLSASRSMTPPQPVRAKQRNGNFPFCMVGETVVLKEKHKYHTQVQMQMGVTGIQKCLVIVFTNVSCPVVVVPVTFEPSFWCSIRQKLLDFHNAYVVPALVNAMFL